ncbi:magnesium transporter [Saccharopolyspora erythraea NRRL 2338]|uniref:Magnesium and cobalt transport protein CorA n=2 Tax=Saccharopolyspora erythraea TaxID=1836 RepID=A4F8K8_SACEN|nr:magnesium and cobalt transport protein CorA [Saccharopolyspora erythraea]EQD85096.1 magnesium transporter CorA [Saccharopolyspora erythraea D]PFG94178.1 magnesium transporter [Saccharopolyspora erythraea NRRL 2338]QRK90959.1 magnesium and cobalt transport protein CorA [Saccharopolyspora erythraea]CAM00383.1 magnesium and cobalt transport protein CorA [Saccharopolyspora erythraea NRRL 2338]
MPSLSSLGLRNRRNGGTRPAQRLPTPVSAYVVDCAIYVDGERLEGSWTHTDAIDEVRRRGSGFVWIGLHEPSEEQINGLAETFGLHELAVEDAVHAHQRPKLERYDNTLFMVLKTVRYIANETLSANSEIVESGELMAFVGRDFVITVRHGKHAGLAQVRHQLEQDPEQLALGPSAVLHGIADHVVDTYLEVTDAIQDDIDEMEAEVFAPRTKIDAEQIYLMKREVMELRRSVMPLAKPLQRLAEGYTPMVPEEVRSYFRNVDDHLATVSERVASFDELLTTLVDATLAKITLQQNTDMRKISAWVAIISTPTMIAGIYGMNFDVMPETRWTFGYPATLLVMMSACVVLFKIFRRNKWL